MFLLLLGRVSRLVLVSKRSSSLNGKFSELSGGLTLFSFDVDDFFEMKMLEKTDIYVDFK